MTNTEFRPIPLHLAARAKEVTAQLVAALTPPFPADAWVAANPHRLAAGGTEPSGDVRSRNGAGQALATLDPQQYLSVRLGNDPVKAVPEILRSIAVGLMMAQAQDFPLLYVHTIVGYAPILLALREFLIEPQKPVRGEWIVIFLIAVNEANEIFNDMYPGDAY